MVIAGFESLRVFDFVEGTEAKRAMERIVLQLNKDHASRPVGHPLKVVEGKSCGQLQRLAGLMQAIQTAQDDVDALLGDRSLKSQSDMMEFMLAVKERQVFNSAHIPDESVPWATGTELESRIPLRFFEEINEEAVERAHSILKLSQQTTRALFGLNTPATQGASSSNGSIGGHSVFADVEMPASTSSVSSEQGERINFLLRVACTTSFELAPLTEIWRTFRVRASNRGENQGPSECPLLASIQGSGILGLVVTGNPAQKKILLRKMPPDSLSVDQKRLLCEALRPLGVTLDEFRAHAKKANFDVPMPDAGAMYSGANLPYGLARGHVPRLFEGGAEKATTSFGSLGSPPGSHQKEDVYEPPVSTQKRGFGEFSGHDNSLDSISDEGSGTLPDDDDKETDGGSELNEKKTRHGTS